MMKQVTYCFFGYLHKQIGSILHLEIASKK